MSTNPIAVIGGGIAGLTAANYLRRNGVPVVLFEAGKQLAGMAQSWADEDGFSYDFGAHFITNRLAAAIGVGAQCRDVRYYGETVRLGSRDYGYPFGLMRVPRYLASAVASRVSPVRDVRSAADWFRNAYGRALADEVAIPLVKEWSGAAADELSPEVGNKLANSVPYTMYLKAMSRWKGVAVSNGYSREMPESPNVWHVYPEGGVALLCHKLAEPVMDCIEMESPVEKVYVDRGRAVAVRARGRDRAVSAVISTAPCHILSKLVTGTDALKPLADFRFRAMIFVNLRLEGRGLLPDTMLWLPEKQHPFFRLTETTLSMPWLAPEGKTIVTCDIGAEAGDEYWRMSDERLGELCLEHFSAFLPDAKWRFLGSRVMRAPFAYPIFHNSYEARRKAFEKSTGVDNLLSIGRHGEFAHILMEDIYWRTLRSTKKLMGSLAGQAPMARAA